MLTWIKASNHGSTIEVTASPFVFILLIVIVECIRSMIPDSVRVVATLSLLNLAAICTPFATSPVQRDLQLAVWRLLIRDAPLLKLPIWEIFDTNRFMRLALSTLIKQHSLMVSVTWFDRNEDDKKQKKQKP